MPKYKVIIAVLLGLLLLQTFALASWNCCNVGSCPSCQAASPCSSCRAVSSHINSCSTPCSYSAAQVCKAAPVVPVILPMEPVAVSGRACLSPCAATTTCAPGAMALFTSMVPVSVQTINGCPTMSATMDDRLANKVVLIPTSSADKQVMMPVLMKPIRGGMMVFSPLDTSLISPSASTAVAMYLKDRMAMVPLDWSSCVTNASLCLPAGEFQMKAQTDINGN